MLTDFCGDCARSVLIVHQKDPALASAFATGGLPQILDNNASAGRICSGKGEAMMAGTVIAKLQGRQFVGFIYADNFVPGTVHEYCKVFATGLYQALNVPMSLELDTENLQEQTLIMVRIKWKSKPKIVEGKLVNQESGRYSRIVNAWMNRLLTSITMREEHSNFIQTANAGKHAMSTDLALKLNFATGYAVEPYQLVNLLGRSGASSCPLTRPPSPSLCGDDGISPLLAVNPGLKIKIMQIETLNPYIHDFSKGEEHIARMQAQGLGTIFHSSLINQETKEQLQAFIGDELGIAVGNGIPEVLRTYPFMQGRKLEAFGSRFDRLGRYLQTDCWCRTMQ